MMNEIVENSDIRKKIVNFQEALKQGPCLNGDELDEALPIKHYFSKGSYAREMSIPKGMIVVGKIHKHEHLNFITKGKVSFVSEAGLMSVEAPFTFSSPAGTKRVIFAHEDSLWTTVHVTDETDLEKIEAETIAKSYEELGLEEP